MQDPEAVPASPLQRGLLWLVYALAAVAGALACYDFGRVIGGPVVGVVLALNGAVFCSIVAGAAVEKLCRWGPGTAPTRRTSAG
jgi:hypothetical protein